MIAYVEIEKVLETARNGYHSDFGRSMADLTSLQEVLEDTPTVDVVEVVRCKDCKWYAPNNDHSWLGCTFDTRCPEDEPRADDFCSYGERKGGAE